MLPGVEDEDTSDPEGDNVLSDFKAKLAQNDQKQAAENTRRSKHRFRLRPNISDGWLVSIKDRLMRHYGIELSSGREDKAAVAPQTFAKTGSSKPVARHPQAKAN